MYTVKVLNRGDLNRQFIRSEACAINIPECQLVLPPSRGQLTTVEGLLGDIVADLNVQQSLRRIQGENAYAKIQEIIDDLKEIIADDEEEDEEGKDKLEKRERPFERGSSRTCDHYYESLLRMIKQWRNLKMLERSGRGHDPAGVNATKPGACAVLCHACPQPGKNLLDGWETAPPEKQTTARWLFAQFLAIDENFRLVRKNWSKNLWDRLSKYSSHLQFRRDGKKVTFLIPKFHLPAHIAACQTSFSHNLIKGMGHTDGEAPERGWANINPVATSTREMAPGSRRDTLDDHFGDYNWKKVTNFGISLLNKMKTAIPERDQHQRDFNEFHNALMDEQPCEIAQWKDAIEQWEADQSNPNPFKTTTITMTQAAVRLKLSQQEAGDLEKGLDLSSLHADISPSFLYRPGSTLRTNNQNALGAHATDLQLAKLQERSNALLRKVEHWCQVQLLYMPMVSRLHTSETASAEIAREEKDADIRGQRANTRASAVLKKVELTVTTAADRYRRAWKALKVLAGVLENPNWEAELPELQPTDIRGMSEGDSGQSERNRTLSWIWKARGVGATGDDNETILSEALRIEWCKSRARASRWAEEVELLQEEMRRVAEFLSWHATWWEEQAVRRTGLTAAEREGVQGYARRQAAMRRAMRDRFLALWSVVPALLQLPSPVAP
ncbi:ZPR1 zinc-finger domain-containing protein [Suillus placidus]|uniref:ZPR1 zinc-finger domain-containing protein n=1 Tax=Suillus placidus TaxID=48579 RepID=A0A9P6ZWR0_9AGAM|nr:ZPR1 zinc-finger domain-containing protein [Suillus placidus]